ncbi:MAG: translocation/assembly module TamB domain-containing protein, partial [Xenococcaceae cyanobacterium]
MNNPNPNDRNESKEQPSSFINNLAKKATSPSTLIVAVTAIALGAVAYEGAKILIAQKLPPYIEQQLSGILDRPIKLGALRNISLNGAEVDGLSIPATANDSDRVSIDKIQVNFNVLPVIFTRTLPVEITLIKPEIYLEQDRQGAWVKLNTQTQPGNESIFIDTKVNVCQGKITAIPYQKSPIVIPVDGNGRYNPSKNKQISYDFQTAIAAAKANIKGETIVETGKTQAKVGVNDLVLADLVPLIPNSPVDINKGRLNANLDINFPSFKEFNATRIQGKISLQQVEAEAKPIPKPIEAISELLFGGNKVKIEDTRGSVGEVVAQVSGDLNIAKGYDVDVKVLPFTLANLAKVLPVKMPVAMNGGLEANLQLRGAVDRPKLTGNINSTEPVQIDKTKFAAIDTNFAADLDKFVLQDVRLKPSAGGEIKGTGIIETKLNNLVKTKEAIAWQNMPMAFDFQAELPTKELVNPYYRLPSQIEVGKIIAKGKVGGTAGKPLASLNWQAPSMSARNITNIAGAGEVLLVGKDLLVRNTKVKVGEGSITVNGKGNLDSNKWQTLIATKSIPITPFLSEIKLPQLNLSQPIALQNGKINLSGTFDGDLLEKIEGIANLDLNVADGSVKLDSKLNAGNLQASLVSDRLAIEQFVNDLPLSATIETSQINLAGKLKQLLSLNVNSPNLDSWQATANAKLAVAEGTVNAAGKLKNNVWQTNITADNLNSTLLSDRLIPNQNRSLFDLPNLNAKANLSGNLSPLLQPNFSTTIKANDLSAQLGNQAIAATGTILLSKLANKTNPFDLASNLNIKANSDLDTLPVRQNVLSQQQINLKGDANFQGKIFTKNLLTAPLTPGNMQLTGKIQLANAVVNKIVFDPILAGNVNAGLGKDISINLRGKQDLIAAAFTPCDRPVGTFVQNNKTSPTTNVETRNFASLGNFASLHNKCILPYLPEYIQFKKG